jgi:hypothetical protein
MLRQDFLGAFATLGRRLQVPVEIILAGGSALVLLGVVDRATVDADAIFSQPKLSALSRDIVAVADELELSPTWINDGVSGFRDLLAADYSTRLVLIGDFGPLTVRSLGRADLILLKIAAGRPRDLDDLRALAPTADELTFVGSQLERINRITPRDALRIQLYLDAAKSE